MRRGPTSRRAGPTPACRRSRRRSSRRRRRPRRSRRWRARWPATRRPRRTARRGSRRGCARPVSRTSGRTSTSTARGPSPTSSCACAPATAGVSRRRWPCCSARRVSPRASRSATARRLPRDGRAVDRARHRRPRVVRGLLRRASAGSCTTRRRASPTPIRRSRRGAASGSVGLRPVLRRRRTLWDAPCARRGATAVAVGGALRGWAWAVLGACVAAVVARWLRRRRAVAARARRRRPRGRGRGRRVRPRARGAGRARDRAAADRDAPRVPRADGTRGARRGAAARAP